PETGPSYWSCEGDPVVVSSHLVFNIYGSCPPPPTPTATATGTPPTLGNYPDTSIPLSSNTIVAPDASPTNTTKITVSTSTSFNGNLETDPATGIVRVTDARPAGTYTVTVRAFSATGWVATKTFTLTVTTPAACTPVSFNVTANVDV